MTSEKATTRRWFVQDEEHKPIVEVEGIRGIERGTLTLKSASVYHVMNNTCIHLRVEYKHVQEGGNIQRTRWRNTIIEKTNIYLIIASENYAKL
jgi:hypothetical protein